MSCKYVVTDGDQQMIQQLEDAIHNYMPWARRGRCSLQIIDRGWANYVNLPLGGYSKKKRGKKSGTKRKPPASLTNANKLARTIYRWMYSWSEPLRCMDEDEFYISKAILFHD